MTPIVSTPKNSVITYASAQQPLPEQNYSDVDARRDISAWQKFTGTKVVKNSYRDHMSLRVPGDEFQDHSPNAPTNADFKFYTMDLSYFCGKLEMYFRYKKINFERIEPTARELDTILRANTGNEQVPQVYDVRASTPNERRWLRDTTPIIEYLEKDTQISRTSKRVLPDCPVQTFFQFLVEDYADEFLWRPAMFWRWEPQFDRMIMGHRFTWEFARQPQDRYWMIPSWLNPYVCSFRQWVQSSFGEGCDTQAKKDVIKEQYLELLNVLQTILDKQPYLFGNHPTLVDFGFSGPFFRHFFSDFTPRKVMQLEAPAVHEWVARLWNCNSDRLPEEANFPPAGELPANWDTLLQLLPDFLAYHHLNAKAYRDGKPDFEWTYKSETCVVPMVPYRAYCRMTLQKRFTDLDAESQDKVKAILQKYGCWDLLWEDGSIEVPPECGIEAPFSIYPPPDPKTREVVSYKWNFNHVLERYFKTQLPTILGAVTLGCGLALAYRARK